jgi:hypothetical protein
MDYEIAFEAANRAYRFGLKPRLTVTAANLECVEFSLGWGPFYLRFEVSAGQKLRALYRDLGLIHEPPLKNEPLTIYKWGDDPGVFTLAGLRNKFEGHDLGLITSWTALVAISALEPYETFDGYFDGVPFTIRRISS